MKNLSYKNNRYSVTSDTTVVSPVIPPGLSVQFREAIAKWPWYELYTIDQAITPIQCRIIGLIRLFEANVGKRISPTLDDLAFCVNASRSKIIRALNSVHLLQYLTIERSRGGNVYSFNDHQMRKVVFSASDRCSDCGAQRPTQKGICAVCRKQRTADLEVASFLAQHPGADYEIVWLKLHANGSTCSRAQIKRAYLRARAA